MSQQQIVFLLELALGATEGADGGVVDVGESVAGGAVAVGVALIVEASWLRVGLAICFIKFTHGGGCEERRRPSTGGKGRRVGKEGEG